MKNESNYSFEGGNMVGREHSLIVYYLAQPGTIFKFILYTYKSINV